MRNTSIRAKIIIWFIVVLMVILASNFAALYFIGERAGKDTAKEDVQEMVLENMDEVRYKKGALPGRDDVSTPHFVIEYGEGYIEIDDFLDLINGVACGLYTTDGKLLYGLNYLPDETKDLHFLDNTIRKVEAGSDAFYVFDRIIILEGADNVWIRGMIDRDKDRGQMNRMYRTYMTFLPIMVLMAALIVFLVTRRALLPLNNIVDEVGRINWGSDLKQRVEVRSNAYEIRTIVDALNNMLSRLDKSYEAGRRFTSNVSHDLRTPVSIISAQAELALEEDISDDTREAFENIQKQSARTKEILDGLLTYMRLEDMSEAYDKTCVDMSSMVETTCDSITIIDDKNVTMEVKVEKGLLIEGHEALIRALIENLLSNAYKYSRQNGHVKVSLDRGEGTVRLTVSDDGIGISPEDKDRIFDWMYRTDNAEHIEGSGIGLYVVKTVADYHDANIDIESELDKGSTFTITFSAIGDGSEEENG